MPQVEPERARGDGVARPHRGDEIIFVRRIFLVTDSIITLIIIPVGPGCWWTSSTTTRGRTERYRR